MFATLLILPVLALVCLCYFVYYPLPLLLGYVKYSQESESIPDQLKSLAESREQDDEYETLDALGFRPLGTRTEAFGFMGTKVPTLVFAHEQFPVFAYLMVNIDQQLYLKLITTGREGRILETTSCQASPGVKSNDYISKKITATKTEDLFASHIQSLSAWELNGFEAIPATTLAESETQYEIMMQKEPVKELIRSCCIQMSLGSLFVTVLLPAIFGPLLALIGTQLLNIPFTIINVLNFIAICSLGYALLWYKTVIKVRRNPERNSFKNRSALLANRHVEIGKTAIDNGVKFDLPFRDTSEVKHHAIPVAIGTVVGGLFLCFVSTLIIAVWVMQCGVFGVLPILFAIFAFCTIVPMGGFAWRVLLGKSRHDLSIQNGVIHSRELQFVFHFDQQCPVNEVQAIRIEPLNKFPNVIQYIGGEADHDLGIMVIDQIPARKRKAGAQVGTSVLKLIVRKIINRPVPTPGTPVYAGAGYTIDTLVSLARALADEIELEQSKLVVSADILNPASANPSETHPDRFDALV